MVVSGSTVRRVATRGGGGTTTRFWCCWNMIWDWESGVGYWSCGLETGSINDDESRWIGGPGWCCCDLGGWEKRHRAGPQTRLQG
jgi:hypothetical protein